MADIIKLESMAMFELAEEERAELSGRLERLAAGFEALEHTITDEASQPLVTVLDLENIMREDAAVKSFTRDEILACAPEQYDGYFQVPGTLV